MTVLIQGNAAFPTHAAEQKSLASQEILAGNFFFVAIFMEGKHCETLRYMKGIQNVLERWEKLT